MRTFLGMILGCLLTVVVLYAHDTMATPSVTTGTATASSVQIVNWSIASSECERMTTGIRLAWDKLTRKVG